MKQKQREKQAICGFLGLVLISVTLGLVLMTPQNLFNVGNLYNALLLLGIFLVIGCKE